MWIFTSFGAFMPALRYPKDVAEGDNRVMQIRARREIDIMRLKALYLPNSGRIVRNAGTDYEVRIYCTREEWADAVRQMSMDIDYQSFKNTTERWNDSQLHNAYMRVWNVLYTALGTRRAFDVTYRSRPAKKGKRGRSGRNGAERIDMVLREYEDYGKRWWDEVEPIDVNDKGWE